MTFRPFSFNLSSQSLPHSQIVLDSLPKSRSSQDLGCSSQLSFSQSVINKPSQERPSQCGTNLFQVLKQPPVLFGDLNSKLDDYQQKVLEALTNLRSDMKELPPKTAACLMPMLEARLDEYGRSIRAAVNDVGVCKFDDTCRRNLLELEDSLNRRLNDFRSALMKDCVEEVVNRLTVKLDECLAEMNSQQKSLLAVNDSLHSKSAIVQMENENVNSSSGGSSFLVVNDWLRDKQDSAKERKTRHSDVFDEPFDIGPEIAAVSPVNIVSSSKWRTKDSRLRRVAGRRSEQSKRNIRRVATMPADDRIISLPCDALSQLLD